MAAPRNSGGKGNEQAIIAFRRLLADAAGRAEARVDALVALSQRTVFAAPWPNLPEEIRTVTNPKGESAITIFTGMDELLKAARRFGWFEPDGSLQHKEMGAREALRQAADRNVPYVVIDIAAEHSVEFVLDEFKPLLEVPQKREATGPFAAAGRLSSTIMEAIKRSSSSPRPRAMDVGSVSNSIPPPTPREATAPQAPVQVPPTAKVPSDAMPAQAGEATAKRPSVRPPPAPPKPQIPSLMRRTGNLAPSKEAVAAAERVSLVMLNKTLGEPLIDALREKLREYPEVEWACAIGIERGGSRSNAVALRVDAALMTRVEEIKRMVSQTAKEKNAAIEVLVLDTVDITRNARRLGSIFYPWQK